MSLHALGAHRHRARNCRVAVVATPGWHHEQLVDDGRTDDVLLAAGDHDAIASAFGDLHRPRRVVDRGRYSPVSVATVRRERVDAWAVSRVSGAQQVGGSREGHASGGGRRCAVAREQHVHLLAQLVLRPRHAVHRVHSAE